MNEVMENFKKAEFEQFAKKAEEKHAMIEHARKSAQDAKKKMEEEKEK